MRPADLAVYRAPQPFRWLSARLWRIEHAFERAKAAGRAENDTRLRMAFILLVFTLGFIGLAGMATRAALAPDVDHGVLASEPIGDRADLVDRNGQLLAVDLPHFGLYYDPKDNWDPEEVRRDLATALPQLSADRLDKALRADRRQYLLGGLTPDDRDKIDDLGLPGVSFEPESRRVYPLGPTASHLIGYTDHGGVGLSGAEFALNKTIRQNAADPVPLSIDRRVQAAVQDELEKAAVMHQAIGGVAILTNVHTGEILGMASYPTFDPNAVGSATPNALLNRVAAARYEPGSVFKVFTLAMGIDSGIANLNTQFDARTPLALSGQTIHDYDKDNSYLPLWEVFTHSSNIGAARLGLMAGADRMDHYFRSFGLFNAAPSELAESARPIVPKSMTDNVVASMSFGHAISLSPLAIATGMTAVLNGGTYIPLTIRKLDPSQYPKGRRVISEATSRTMLDLMRLNVTHGTGSKADAPGYSVGGKTGSAEKPEGGVYNRTKLVSSFAAVFPTDGALSADRYFLLVMLDEPKPTKETFGFATGGWTAAPAAGRMIERVAPYLGVHREPVALVASAAKTTDPDQLNGGER
jgi:cell division protein FtsI (penicillin-binding protein 3)